MRFKVNKTSKLWLVTMLSAVLSSWTGLAHSQTQTQTLGQAPDQIHDEIPALNAQLWNDILNDRATAVMKQLAAGLDPNIKSKEGQPAVMWAIQNNSWQVYDLLRQHKNFDVNITNINNETPLMYLAILGELARGQQLVQQGAKINRLGWTPLHYAASKGQLEFARWLLDQEAFIHAPAPDGTTPLMMAAYSGNKEVVDLFLQAGADLNAINIQRYTAADWAESANHTRLANYLHSLSTGAAVADSADGRLSEAEQQGAQAGQSSSGGSGSAKYFDLERFE